MRVYRGGILCPYPRMYILAYYTHVSKSPKMRVYRGGILCLYLRYVYPWILSPRPQVSKDESVYGWYIVSLSPYVYPWVLSPRPQVSKNESVWVVVYCVPISVCISVAAVPTSPGPQKWECIGAVYCVSISVRLSVGTVPTSPSLQKLRVYCGGILCPYLRMYIRRCCPHVARSPKMRAYRGWITISVCIS